MREAIKILKLIDSAYVAGDIATLAKIASKMTSLAATLYSSESSGSYTIVAEGGGEVESGHTKEWALGYIEGHPRGGCYRVILNDIEMYPDWGADL